MTAGVVHHENVSKAGELVGGQLYARRTICYKAKAVN